MLAIVALVAGATFGAYRAWDRATKTRDDNGGVLAGGAASATPSTQTPLPPEGEVIVTGTVTSAHFEGATIAPLPTPITVTTAVRGEGGATITPVEAQGKSTSIEWNAGQPLPLAGDGGNLVLGPVAVDAANDVISLILDGVHGLTPGTYAVATSVAVGSQARDSVTFTATDKTTIEFRGTASTPSPTPDLTTGGTGNVSLAGTLTIAHPDGTSTPAASISLDGGTYTITLTPASGGGFTVHATLHGTVH